MVTGVRACWPEMILFDGFALTFFSPPKKIARNKHSLGQYYSPLKLYSTISPSRKNFPSQTISGSHDRTKHMELTPVAAPAPEEPVTIFNSVLKDAVAAAIDSGVLTMEEFNTKIAEAMTAEVAVKECQTRSKGGKLVLHTKNQWVELCGPFETQKEAKKNKKKAFFGDNNGNWAYNRGNKANKHKNHGLHTICVLFVYYSILFLYYFRTIFQAPSRGSTATRTWTAPCR